MTTINLVDPERAEAFATGVFGKLAAAIREPLVKKATKWLRSQYDCAVAIPANDLTALDAAPSWAFDAAAEGKTIHRFVLSGRARDILTHIKDTVEDAVRAQKAADLAERKEAELLVGAVHTKGIDHLYEGCEAWWQRPTRVQRDAEAYRARQRDTVEVADEPGMTWEKALPTDLRQAGAELSNCLSGSSWRQSVKSGSQHVWILRDPQGRAVAAAAVNPQASHLTEAKESSNRMMGRWSGALAALLGRLGIKYEKSGGNASALQDLPVLGADGPWTARRMPNGEVHMVHDDGTIMELLTRSGNGLSFGYRVWDAMFGEHSNVTDAGSFETAALAALNALTAAGTAIASGSPSSSRNEGVWFLPGPTGWQPADRVAAASLEVDGWRASAIVETRRGDWRSQREEHEFSVIVLRTPDGEPLLIDHRGKYHTRFIGRLPTGATMARLLNAVDPACTRVILNFDAHLEGRHQGERIVRQLGVVPTETGWQTVEQAAAPFAAGAIRGFTVVRYATESSYSYDRDTRRQLVVELLSDDLRPLATAYLYYHSSRNISLCEPYRRDLAVIEADMTLQAAFVRWAKTTWFKGAEVEIEADTVRYRRRFGAHSDWIRRTQEWEPALPDRDGRAQWTDPKSGAVVYAVPGKSGLGPKRFVCVATDRRVLWSMSPPKGGEVTTLHLPQSEGIQSLAEYLARKGWRLANSTASSVTDIGGSIVNGIPVRISFPHLAEVADAGGALRFKRVARPTWSTASAGEDRFWVDVDGSHMRRDHCSTLLGATGGVVDGAPEAALMVVTGNGSDWLATAPGLPSADELACLRGLLAETGLVLHPLQAARIGVPGHPDRAWEPTPQTLGDRAAVALAPRGSDLAWTVIAAEREVGTVLVGARVEIRLAHGTPLGVLSAVTALIDAAAASAAR